MRLRSFLCVAALVSGAATLYAPPALGAGGQASFAVKPVLYDPALTATKSYFIMRAKAGDVIADKVRVVNTGTTAGTAYLYVVDATTGQTSGAVYLSRRSPRHDVGAWVRLARTQVSLAPGASAVVPFTIRVPAVVRPGDHLGGIVAENSEIQKGSGHGALQIRIKHLTIAAVELQLPGRVVARVDSTGVEPGGQHGWQYVYVHLRNTGTVMVKPQSRIVIESSSHRQVAARTLSLDTFVPGTAIDYPVLLPHRTLKPGRYTATVTIRSSDRTIAGYRTSPPPPFSSTHTYAFTVSSGEQKQIFSGVAPVTAPTQTPTATSGHSGKGLVTLAGGGAMVLLLLGLGFHVVRKRRVVQRRTEVEAEVPAPVVPPAPVPAHDAPTALMPAVLPALVAPVRMERAVREPDRELENLPGAALGFALLVTAAFFAVKLLERDS